MADIAVVFHWTPETMACMTLTELSDWLERARVRSQPPTKRD